jgi:hypothetical protein
LETDDLPFFKLAISFTHIGYEVNHVGAHLITVLEFSATGSAKRSNDSRRSCFGFSLSRGERAGVRADVTLTLPSIPMPKPDSVKNSVKIRTKIRAFVR